MAPKKKKPKRQEEKEEVRNLDRLSDLPDVLLMYILSFLDTSDSVKVSILSKRFKELWTYSQCLDFRFPSLRSGSSMSSSRADFEYFVYRVLQLREHGDLNSFRLFLHESVCLAFIQKCVDYAAQHNVKHLELRAYPERGSVRLPEKLITSTNLVTLSLNSALYHCIELPKPVVLPNLKDLRLKRFEFFDGNLGCDFFMGCPNLETLVLNKCLIRPRDKMKVLDVNCLNLKNLEIRNWRSPWRCFHEQMITVSAPKLEYFLYQGHAAKVIFKVGLIHLKEARIDMCYPVACVAANVYERRENTLNVLLWMLREINNVTTLSLSSSTIEILSGIPHSGERLHTVFENLRFLEFTSEYEVNDAREAIRCIGTITRSLRRISNGLLGFPDACTIVTCTFSL